MTTVVSTAALGVVFGVVLAAPPGPMNAVIAEESVLRGWGSGVLAGLGAMAADLCFFVLALVGAVTLVERYPSVRGVMVAAGGLLMLYFAYGAARGALETEGFAGEGPDGESRGFRKAFVLALTNPYQVVFWLTVGVGMLRPGRIDVLERAPYVGDSLAGLVVVETGSPALVVGFFAGIGIWVLTYPAALVSVGRRVDQFAPAVAGLSAVVLAGFGVVFLLDAVGTLAGL